jgi:predicted ArsR family transcriptional regulator
VDKADVLAQLHPHEGRTAAEIAAVLGAKRQAVVNALVALRRAHKAERVAPEGVAGFPGAKDGVALWFAIPERGEGPGA